MRLVGRAELPSTGRSIADPYAAVNPQFTVGAKGSGRVIAPACAALTTGMRGDEVVLVSATHAGAMNLAAQG